MVSVVDDISLIINGLEIPENGYNRAMQLSPESNEDTVKSLLGWVNHELDRSAYDSTEPTVLFPNLDTDEKASEPTPIMAPPLDWTQIQIDTGKSVYEQRLTQAFIQKDQSTKLTRVSTESFKQGVQDYQEHVQAILADYVSICAMLQSPRDRLRYLQAYLPESDWQEEVQRMSEDGPLKYVIGLRKKLAISLKQGIAADKDIDALYFELPEYFKLFWPNVQTVRAAFSSLLPVHMKQA